MAYHQAKIQKGVLGEISKIQEELDELKDAAAQGVVIMELCELADIIGAVEAYLETHHNSINLEDLQKMAALTRSAFQDGTRR